MDIKNPIVPWLRSGKGASPADGGCVMQIVDWLSTGGWSDFPACVHPYLRTLAIAANDTLPNNERQTLIDLIPRLMNTNTLEGTSGTTQLHIAGVEFVLPLFTDAIKRTKIEHALTRAKQGKGWCRAVAHASSPFVGLTMVVVRADDHFREVVAVPRRSHLPLNLLLHVLDTYDHITGRTVQSAPNYEKVCALAPALVKNGE